MAGTEGRDLQAEADAEAKKGCYWLACSPQFAQSQGWPTYSEQGSPPSITNLEKALQACLQADLMEASSQLSVPLPKWLEISGPQPVGHDRGHRSAVLPQIFTLWLITVTKWELGSGIESNSVVAGHRSRGAALGHSVRKAGRQCSRLCRADTQSASTIIMAHSFALWRSKSLLGCGRTNFDLFAGCFPSTEWL